MRGDFGILIPKITENISKIQNRFNRLQFSSGMGSAIVTFPKRKNALQGFVGG